MEGLIKRVDSHRLERLEGQITELWGHINAATYRFLMLLAEYDRIEGWAEHGCCNCAHWLNWQCGIGRVAAREKVRVARALEGLPQIAEAFRLGRLSYSKVRAMTRIATAATESGWLNIALHGTASHVERVVRLSRRITRLEEAEQAAAAYRQRFCRYSYQDDGSLRLTARLPAEVGAVVLQALEAAIEQCQHQAAGVSAESSLPEPSLTQAAGGVCPESSLAPAAGVSAESSLAQTAIGVSAESYWAARSADGDDINEDDPIGSRRADALRHLAECYLHAERRENPTSADRYQVIVHVDQDALSGADQAQSRCDIEAGPRLAIDTARRLACDSQLIGLIESGDGEPLSVGRKTRAIPASIRRALKARDSGCRFPGCERSALTEGHHVKHWAEGGETKLGNLITLCRFHHRLVHEGGFDVKTTDDGVFVFTNAQGRRISENGMRKGSFRGIANDASPSPEALYAEHAALGLLIDTDTARTKWTGERLDYDFAIAGLHCHEYEKWETESRVEQASSVLENTV